MASIPQLQPQLRAPTEQATVDMDRQGRSEDDIESPITAEKGLSDPPDGGFRAWFHAFLGHMVFFNTWGVVNSFGVFQQYYEETLDISPSTIGWIGGVPMFLLFFVGIVSGRASDAGYFRHCFITGVFLQVFGLMMASLSTKYYQLLLSQGVCVGIGMGLIFTPGLSVSSSYFKKRRTFAVGICAAGAALGGMVYPAAVNSLLRHTTIGFPWTMRIVAFIVLFTHIPSMIGYRPYLPKRTSKELVDWSAFRQSSWVIFSVGMFLEFWGLYLAFFYLGTFAKEELHISNTVNLIIVLNGVGVIGRIAPNVIGERFTGVYNIAIIVSAVCAILVLCWIAIGSVAGLYAWTVFYGIFAGGMQSLFPALATQQAPEPSKVGTWTGMTLGIVSFACLTASPIQGAIIQASGGSYLGAQLFAAISILLGGVMIAWSRAIRFGFSPAIKV